MAGPPMASWIWFPKFGSANITDRPASSMPESFGTGTRRAGRRSGRKSPPLESEGRPSRHYWVIAKAKPGGQGMPRESESSRPFRPLEDLFRAGTVGDLSDDELL